MAEMKDRLLDVAKGAVELNLRYMATVVSLATGYVSEFGEMLRDSNQGGTGGATDAHGGAAPTPQPRRPPILLVGQLHDEPTGAFALNNTSERDLSINLIVQGDLDPGLTELTPTSLRLAPGASAFVRLKVRITEAVAVNHDHFVSVLAPGLSAPAVEFVVRRLPDSS
jgi:hypothetical protein